MPAGVASGDIAQNYLLEPLSQAAATQLYRKDTVDAVGMTVGYGEVAGIDTVGYCIDVILPPGSSPSLHPEIGRTPPLLRRTN